MIFCFIISTIFPSGSFESTVKPKWDIEFDLKKLVKVQNNVLQFVYDVGNILYINDASFKKFCFNYKEISKNDADLIIDENYIDKVTCLYDTESQNFSSYKETFKTEWIATQDTINQLSKMNSQYIQENTNLIAENEKLSKALREKDDTVQISVLQAQIASLNKQIETNNLELQKRNYRIVKLEQELSSLKMTSVKKMSLNKHHPFLERFLY